MMTESQEYSLEDMKRQINELKTQLQKETIQKKNLEEKLDKSEKAN